MITIVAVILFMLFLCLILAGVTDGNTTMAFVGYILAVLLGLGVAVYTFSDTLTEPAATKTTEVESTTTETDKAAKNLITSFRGEDAVESEKASEETEGDNLLITIIAMLVIFSPLLLFMVSDLIEDVINFISDLIENCFLKKKKETATQKFVRETNENSEDNPFIEKISTSKQKKGINIDKLAEKDSKIAYIVWAV